MSELIADPHPVELNHPSAEDRALDDVSLGSLHVAETRNAQAVSIRLCTLTKDAEVVDAEGGEPLVAVMPTNDQVTSHVLRHLADHQCTHVAGSLSYLMFFAIHTFRCWLKKILRRVRVASEWSGQFLRSQGPRRQHAF